MLGFSEVGEVGKVLEAEMLGVVALWERGGEVAAERAIIDDRAGREMRERGSGKERKRERGTVWYTAV